MNNAQPIWQPEHFPIGTKVMFDSPNITTDRETVYTVLDIVRNGPNSYCLRIDKPSVCIEDDLSAIHISHVSRIIQRGTGGMGHAYARVRDTSQACLESNFSTHPVPLKKKTHYRSRDVGAVLHNLSILHTRNNQVVDIPRMAKAYALTGQVKPLYLEIKRCTHFGSGEVYKIQFGVSIPKKKARAWVKQNINRFLVSPKQAQEEADAFWYEDMEDSWDSDHEFTDEFNSPSGVRDCLDNSVSYTPAGH